MKKPARLSLACVTFKTITDLQIMPRRAGTKSWMILLLTFVLSLPPVISNDGIISTDNSGVMEAYELRINGKADKAQELLTALLQSDSTNALAYFELARTKHHLFLGSSQYSSAEWADVMKAMQQAVKYAPKNEIFAFNYAYDCFFNAFISMMRQNPDAGENVKRSCDAFNAVLKLNPDCYEAMLYLAEIYGMLPAEMGGDRDKASAIAADLMKKDAVLGALANSMLLPDTADRVLFWQNTARTTGMTAQVLEELGRAFLLKSDSENGTKYFQDAIAAEPSRRHLYMHLVRYHILSAGQDQENQAKHLEEAEKLANLYMTSDPELLPPLKAYCNGILALIRMIGKDDAGSNKYKEIATSIDPFYSKAMGMPSLMLYGKPDEVKIQYSSFFMPF